MILDHFDELRAEETTTIYGVTFSNNFTTSADAVRKACGLRFEAIRVIANEQGVEINDPACSNINLNLLAALADAHVSRLRTYYNNVQRHTALLGTDELTTFVEFCETFKKRQVETVCSWDNIDVDSVKEQFFRKVKELTPRQRRQCNSTFSALSERFCEIIEIKLENIGLAANKPDEYQEVIDSFSCQAQDKRLLNLCKDNIIERVITSAFCRPCSKKASYNVDHRKLIRKVTISARFHIFIDEDERHLKRHCDNQHDLLIGALRMIA